MSKHNLDALSKLLANATKSANQKPALWSYLLDKVDEIEAAQLAGITYKEQAEAVGVSAHSFSLALKKAKAVLAEREEAEAAEIEAEHTAIEEVQQQVSVLSQTVEQLTQQLAQLMSKSEEKKPASEKSAARSSTKPAISNNQSLIQEY